jgi:hypothetical protein
MSAPDIDCTLSNLTPQEKNYCNCQAAVQIAVQLMREYDNQLLQYVADDASWIRWNNLHKEWSDRRGQFEKYKVHGKSQDFRVEWGWADWDTNNTCRECANNKWGWGENSKIPGGAWCNGQSGRLLGAYAYQDSGDWGWHAWHAGSRKWWSCKKSDAQKSIENQEYNAVEPIVDPSDQSKVWKGIPRPQRPGPPNIGDIVCCSQVFRGIEVQGGDVDFSNISQICGITKTTTTDTTAAPVTAPAAAPAVATTPASTPESTISSGDITEYATQQNLLIGGGISVSFSILLSLIILFLIYRK